MINPAVMLACQACIATCKECIVQCETCPNKDAMHQSCVDACKKCIVDCEKCIADCINGVMNMDAMTKCSKDCMACIEMLETCAETCPLCKQVCEKCSEACGICSEMCDMATGKDRYSQLPVVKAAVKAVGDWELDVLAIPFNSKDSDGQGFDENTDIMHEAFNTPLAVYQHGVKQGAKALQDKLIIVGKTQAGTLEKKADGWHIRVILDKAVAVAKGLMDAAKQGM